jgi:putative transposase
LATPIPSTRSGQVWEHLIRDAYDFERQVDYIHYNPVKHGFVLRLVDWPLSSIHRYIKQHIINEDWAGCDDLERMDFGEI